MSATVSESVASAFENAKALLPEGSAVVVRDIAGAGLEPATSGFLSPVSWRAGRDSYTLSLTAVRPVPSAVPLHQRNGNHGLRLVRVIDRIAARRLRGALPGRLHELEGAAELAAAADRVRVAA